MNRTSCVILLLSGVLAAAYAADQDIRPRFEHLRAVEGTFAVGEKGRLAVPGDVFGQSRDFPNDQRILGADGTQWPFFLYVPKDTVETETLAPEILNRSFVGGRKPYLQFDLEVPPANGKAAVHNRMELTTSGRDFIRRVDAF